MFGIAVWDDRRRRAVLARDRLGVKPLYYARVGDLVVFASELKSLLASGLVGADLDYEAIDAYLTLGFVAGPDDAARRGVEAAARPRLVIVDADGVASSATGATREPAGRPASRSTEYAAGAARRSSRSPCGCA